MSQHVDPGTTLLSEQLFVPLLPIADWFVAQAPALAFEETASRHSTDEDLHQSLHEWERLSNHEGESAEASADACYDWYQRHFWLSGAKGTLLPDLAWARSDDVLWISWEPYEAAGARRRRFLEPTNHLGVSWRPAFEALCGFVAYVASECRRLGLGGRSWIQVETPLENAVDVSGAEFIQLVNPAALDLVPASARASKPEDSPALQASRDVLVDQQSVESLREALARVEAGSHGCPSARMQELRAELLSTRTLSPWDDGYAAAATIRRRLGIESGPLNTQTMREWLGDCAEVHWIETTSVKNSCVVGIREHRTRGAATLFRNPRTSMTWAMRMELARCLGHLLLDFGTPKGVLGAGSSQRSKGPRGKRSGAFAAALILPESACRQRFRDGDDVQSSDFADLMTSYEVGARTAAYNLFNFRIIGRDRRDDLIEEFGSDKGPISSPSQA